MEMLVRFGKAIKHKTSNRRWLDYECDGEFENRCLRISNASDAFIYWLTENFGERIDKHDLGNTGLRVLVFSDTNDFSSYWFFRADGKLADISVSGGFSNLYDQYLQEKGSGWIPFSQNGRL